MGTILGTLSRKRFNTRTYNEVGGVERVGRSPVLIKFQCSKESPGTLCWHTFASFLAPSSFLIQQVGEGEAQAFAFLTSSWVMPMMLPMRPHFEWPWHRLERHRADPPRSFLCSVRKAESQQAAVRTVKLKNTSQHPQSWRWVHWSAEQKLTKMNIK